MDYKLFDEAISDGKIQAVDRAVALLWFAKTAHDVEGMTAKEIALALHEKCGHPVQNASRLHDRLHADRRTSKFGATGFRLRPDAFRALQLEYGHQLAALRKPKPIVSSSLIPVEIFEQAKRSYLTRVVEQINGCYDHGFFDGVMVLGRRLLESLVIGVYEQSGRSIEIKNAASGSFLTFDELVGKISADGPLHVSRETKKALGAMKAFGDQSAHNPKFTARESDVDGIKHGMRVAAEELLMLCKF